MTEDQAKAIALALVERAEIAMVGSIGLEGDPQIKAMIKAEHEGLKTIWFSTNTSSEHVAQFRKDPRACVYFAEWADEPWRGVTLGGRIELFQDHASRERLWEDGCERYYPKGVDDPDYTVLRFTAHWGKVYQSLDKGRFDVA
jgi:general stress protein 26